MYEITSSNCTLWAYISLIFLLLLMHRIYDVAIKASNSYYYLRAYVSFTSQLRLIEAYCLSVNSVLRTLCACVCVYCWCYCKIVLNATIVDIEFHFTLVQYVSLGRVKWKLSTNLQQQMNNSYFSLFLSLCVLTWKTFDLISFILSLKKKYVKLSLFILYSNKWCDILHTEHDFQYEIEQHSHTTQMHHYYNTKLNFQCKTDIGTKTIIFAVFYYAVWLGVTCLIKSRIIKFNKINQRAERERGRHFNWKFN